jgi:cyclopropane fatty-acyl-phospholipid synthase-like methyltransferase
MAYRFSIAIALAACGSPKSPAPVQPARPDHADHARHGHHGHGGGMQHGFEKADDWAKVFDDPARDAWQQPDAVIAALGLTPAMTVADIGAGTGYFAVRLARAVPEGQVIATDIEPDMVRYLEERATRESLPNLRAVQTPPADPQLAEASLDRILVVDVWHHLGDRVGYARALGKALKPGGAVAIVDFKLDAKFGPPKQHRLAPEAIIADLKAAGLTASVSPVALSEQYIVIATK